MHWICCITLRRWEIDEWSQENPRPHCTGLGFEHQGALWRPPKTLNAGNAQLVGKLAWAKKNSSFISSQRNLMFSASLWDLYHSCCHCTDGQTEAQKAIWWGRALWCCSNSSLWWWPGCWSIWGHQRYSEVGESSENVSLVCTWLGLAVGRGSCFSIRSALTRRGLSPTDSFGLYLVLHDIFNT